MSSSRSGQITAFAAIGAAFLALTPVAAIAVPPPPPTTGACTPPGKGKFIASVAVEEINSLSFVNIPSTRVAFQQGTKPGCVIVRFTATMQAPGAGDLVVRALLDNGTEAFPGRVSFGGTDVTGAATIEFIFSNVSPGTHHVNMQFLSPDGTAVVFERTTFVQFGQ